jgi:hypothetical protein
MTNEITSTSLNAPTIARVRPARQARSTSAAAVDGPWPEAQRLVVLVPAELQSEGALAARIFEVAQPRGLNVLYLGLAIRPQDEARLRQRLALLAASTRDNHAVKSDYRLAVGQHWLTWLREMCQPGDLVVCHREQRLRRAWRTFPLAEPLAAFLRLPVVELEGLSAVEEPPLGEPARAVLFWLGAFLVLAGFFWAQVGIQGQAEPWVQSVLISATVVVEFIVLTAWYHWLR